MLKHIVEPITGIDFLVHVGSPITWGVYERVGERGGGGGADNGIFRCIAYF